MLANLSQLIVWVLLKPDSLIWVGPIRDIGRGVGWLPDGVVEEEEKDEEAQVLDAVEAS